MKFNLKKSYATKASSYKAKRNNKKEQCLKAVSIKLS